MGKKRKDRPASGLSMDDFLAERNLWRKLIAKDGSCLFRAVSEQILHCQSRHEEVRLACVAFMKANPDLFESFVEEPYYEYLEKMKSPQAWAGQLEIEALSRIYHCDFELYREVGGEPIQVTNNSFERKITLCFSGGEHYDNVYSATYPDMAGFCQSVVYGLLMKASGQGAEPNQESNGTNSGKRMSTELQICLDESRYRNTEYEGWKEARKVQQQADHAVATQMQFNIGDHCSIKLNGRTTNVIIRNISPNRGPVIVWVPSQGREEEVPFSRLKSLTVGQAGSGGQYGSASSQVPQHCDYGSGPHQSGSQDNYPDGRRRKKFGLKKDDEPDDRSWHGGSYGDGRGDQQAFGNARSSGNRHEAADMQGADPASWPGRGKPQYGRSYSSEGGEEQDNAYHKRETNRQKNRRRREARLSAERREQEDLEDQLRLVRIQGDRNEFPELTPSQPAANASNPVWVAGKKPSFGLSSVTTDQPKDEDDVGEEGGEERLTLQSPSDTKDKVVGETSWYAQTLTPPPAACDAAADESHQSGYGHDGQSAPNSTSATSGSAASTTVPNVATSSSQAQPIVHQLPSNPRAPLPPGFGQTTAEQVPAISSHQVGIPLESHANGKGFRHAVVGQTPGESVLTNQAFAYRQQVGSAHQPSPHPHIEPYHLQQIMMRLQTQEQLQSLQTQQQQQQHQEPQMSMEQLLQLRTIEQRRGHSQVTADVRLLSYLAKICPNPSSLVQTSLSSPDLAAWMVKFLLSFLQSSGVSFPHVTAPSPCLSNDEAGADLPDNAFVRPWYNFSVKLYKVMQSLTLRQQQQQQQMQQLFRKQQQQQHQQQHHLLPQQHAPVTGPGEVSVTALPTASGGTVPASHLQRYQDAHLHIPVSQWLTQESVVQHPVYGSTASYDTGQASLGTEPAHITSMARKPSDVLHHQHYQQMVLQQQQRQQLLQQSFQHRQSLHHHQQQSLQQPVLQQPPQSPQEQLHHPQPGTQQKLQQAQLYQQHLPVNVHHNQHSQIEGLVGTQPQQQQLHMPREADLQCHSQSYQQAGEVEASPQCNLSEEQEVSAGEETQDLTQEDKPDESMLQQEAPDGQLNDSERNSSGSASDVSSSGQSRRPADSDMSWRSPPPAAGGRRDRQYQPRGRGDGFRGARGRGRFSNGSVQHQQQQGPRRRGGYHGGGSAGSGGGSGSGSGDFRFGQACQNYTPPSRSQVTPPAAENAYGLDSFALQANGDHQVSGHDDFIPAGGRSQRSKSGRGQHA